MRRDLGRIFLTIFTLLHVEVFASTYTWSGASNKTEAFVQEAIHLKYVCSFTNASELYTIEFNPAGEYEKYTLKNLRQSEHIVEGKRVNSYEFVAFAKEAGKIEFDFEAIMKKTTKESIENTVIGRDNVQKEDFTKEIFRQKTLNVDIKETNTQIVGNFTIQEKKNRPEVKAYEPYHMQITIKGDGNFEAIKPIEFNIDGVRVFAEEVVLNQTLTEGGYHGEWSQKFAFVGDKDFKIPQINIEYFNLHEQKIESLVLKDSEVSVAKGYSKEELLDDVLKKEFELDYSYLYYVLVFIAGFLMAKVEFKKIAPKKNSDEEFMQRVKSAKSLDELMIILILKDSKKYEKIVFDIEAKKIVSLKGAKSLILD